MRSEFSFSARSECPCAQLHPATARGAKRKMSTTDSPVLYIGIPREFLERQLNVVQSQRQLVLGRFDQTVIDVVQGVELIHLVREEIDDPGFGEMVRADGFGGLEVLRAGE